MTERELSSSTGTPLELVGRLCDELEGRGIAVPAERTGTWRAGPRAERDVAAFAHQIRALLESPSESTG